MAKRVNIGVDVSKDTLDFSLRVGAKVVNQQVINSKSYIKLYIEELLQKYPDRILLFCYESTNNYHMYLKRALVSQKLPFKEVNPHSFSHYLKHLNSYNKSDVLDSDGLSLFCSTLDDCDFISNQKKYTNAMKSYTTTIKLLSKIQTQLKNFLSSQKQIEDDLLDELIMGLVKQVNVLKIKLRDISYQLCTELIPETAKILEEIKGVGKDLAINLFPILADNRDKNNKQIASYLGLSPTHYQSGTSVYRRPSISKRGNSSVRKSLFMSALSSIRFNKRCKEKYEKMLARGKQKKVALVAIMNFLVRWIRSYFRKENEILYNIS